MKITRSAEQIANYKKLKEEATKDCFECPSCGESKLRESEYWDNHVRTPSHGISWTETGSWKTGIFNTKHWQKLKFACHCGVRWESDPYEVEIVYNNG